MGSANHRRSALWLWLDRQEGSGAAIMGRMLVIAVAQRDVMVVQGVLIVFATSFVMVNLFVDLAYAVFDPRISYS